MVGDESYPQRDSGKVMESWAKIFKGWYSGMWMVF